MAFILSLITRRYTDKLKSLNASFREVFLSVDAFRCPIINAQGMPKILAGNVLLCARNYNGFWWNISFVFFGLVATYIDNLGATCDGYIGTNDSLFSDVNALD